MATATKQRPKAEVQGVTFSRAMFESLQFFPAILDRSRMHAPGLVPMSVIGQIQAARSLIHEYRDWAEQHPDEDVTVSPELWALIKDWPPLLERCRTTPAVRFSGAEVDGIVKTRTLWPEVGE